MYREFLVFIALNILRLCGNVIQVEHRTHIGSYKKTTGITQCYFFKCQKDFSKMMRG